MPDSSKSTLFVSSVQKELAAERRALKDYVHNDPLLRQFFEVFLFEDLPASGRRADEVYLGEVDRCDVYVGIFGNSYGFEDANGVSPTEREFDRATVAGKERLVFVKGISDTARHPKMLALTLRASDQVVRRRFSTLPELTGGLYGSLVERLARAGEIRSLPFDAAACPRATLDDLSPRKVAEFLRRAQSRRGYALAPETPMRDALIHLNLLDRDRPSHAAVLLFADDPQRFLPTSFVKCLRFHGTEVRKPIPAYSSLSGTVFELVDQAVDFVMSKLDRAVGTRARAIRPRKITNFRLMPSPRRSSTRSLIATMPPTPRFRLCFLPTGWKFGVLAKVGTTGKGTHYILAGKGPTKGSKGSSTPKGSQRAQRAREKPLRKNRPEPGKPVTPSSGSAEKRTARKRATLRTSSHPDFPKSRKKNRR